MGRTDRQRDGRARHVMWHIMVCSAIFHEQIRQISYSLTVLDCRRPILRGMIIAGSDDRKNTTPVEQQICVSTKDLTLCQLCYNLQQQ